MKNIILILIVTLSLSGCFIKLTPQQYALLPVNDNPDTIASEQLKEILPKFAGVGGGDYKLVPRGAVKRNHDAPWCFPGVRTGKNGINNIAVSDVLSPTEWNSDNYSMDLVKEMRGYAFGVANVISNIKNSPDFMVNILVDEDGAILLYDARTCQWLEPHTVNRIVITQR